MLTMDRGGDAGPVAPVNAFSRTPWWSRANPLLNPVTPSSPPPAALRSPAAAPPVVDYARRRALHRARDGRHGSSISAAGWPPTTISANSARHPHPVARLARHSAGHRRRSLKNLHRLMVLVPRRQVQSSHRRTGRSDQHLVTRALPAHGRQPCETACWRHRGGFEAVIAGEDGALFPALMC